ncbi:MAG: exodeoxyribonuclease III [Candidatus Rokubacteria bacterium]|nr:exodeoxyribonuclease III [Candidatus Rokubacteria bacterium]
MKLISWNVNGIRAAWKKGLLEFVAASSPDVLCVQETKIQADQITPEMRDLEGYRSYWSVAEKKGYSGVATFSKPEPLAVATAFGVPVLDAEGRIVHAEYPDFHLFNVYFPNSGMGPERLAHKLAFYDEFLALTERLRSAGKGVIVCGDVNTAHTEIDLARPKENAKSPGFMPVERAWVSRFVAHGYHDTFRIFVSEPGHYTWWDMRRVGARARNVGWRIDYFFVSDELRGRVKAAGILPHVQGSDHCPVTLELG